MPRVNQVLTEAKFEAPAEPASPREPVKVGNLGTGSAAPATVNKPIDQVQTGGFGDPKGLPGPSNPNRAANIGHFGSPALPPAPATVTAPAAPMASAARLPAQVSVTARRSLPLHRTRAVLRGTVKAGGFANAAAATDAPKPKQAEAAAAVQEVVILEKPKPMYTDEARKLGIEGDVLVDVVFPASGPVQVIRVIKGLGHGLDEAAIRAAQQIRFKPALQDGKPVDFPATVISNFKLRSKIFSEAT